MIPIFQCCSRRSKGVPSGSRVFLRLLVGELGIPKLAQIFAHGKWLYPYRIHGASDLYRRCLKMRNSKDGCTFPPNIFATKYLHPKIPFWGTFQCKTYYRNYILYIILQRLYIIEIRYYKDSYLCKSHVNGATKLKLYSYISIGKYLGNRVCQTFFRQGPLMQIWDPVLSRKLLELES